MADIELVIKIPEGVYRHYKKVWQKRRGSIPESNIAFGIPLPKGHGRIVDIGKIDADRIESDNPVLSLNIGGEYIEAVSLDYLYNLPPIVEADEVESEDDK